MDSIIAKTYPLLCEIVNGKVISARANEVISACSTGNDRIRRLFDETHLDIDTPRRHYDLLIYCLCSVPVAAGNCILAQNLENDLNTLRKTLSLETLKSSYRMKLIDNNQFKNVVYEIAVASALARFLDDGTLKLEAPLVDSKKNSDVTGVHAGQKYRVEITVLKETISSEDVQTRSLMDPHEMEALPPNPSGMISMNEIIRKAPNHNNTPVSKKIRDILRRKIGQCESGVVNVIVFGLDCPMYDTDLEDALFGAPFVIATQETNGIVKSHSLERMKSGSFLPREKSKDVGQFIEPYRIISATWRLRLDASYPESTIFLNPNADTPLPEEAKSFLERLGIEHAARR